MRLIYALIVYKRLNDTDYDSKNVNFLIDCFENGKEDIAYDFIKKNVDSNLYSLGINEYDKISLLNDDTDYCVRFMNRCIVERRTKEDGYIVMYNYCRKLQSIRNLCYDIQENTDIVFSVEKAEKLCIFNDTIE